MNNKLLKLLKFKEVVLELNTPMITLNSSETGELETITAMAHYSGTLIDYDDDFIYINAADEEAIEVTENTKAIAFKSVGCISKYEVVEPEEELPDNISRLN